MKRILAVVAATLVVAAIAPATTQAAVPAAQQGQVWQRICAAAGGTISPQPGLVCVRTGSQFSSGGLSLLQRVCESGLGGTFVFRSEFPTDLAACFF